MSEQPGGRALPPSSTVDAHPAAEVDAWLAVVGAHAVAVAAAIRVAGDAAGTLRRLAEVADAGDDELDRLLAGAAGRAATGSPGTAATARADEALRRAHAAARSLLDAGRRHAAAVVEVVVPPDPAVLPPANPGRAATDSEGRPVLVPRRAYRAADAERSMASALSSLRALRRELGEALGRAEDARRALVLPLGRASADGPAPVPTGARAPAAEVLVRAREDALALVGAAHDTVAALCRLAEAELAGDAAAPVSVGR